MRRLLAGGDVDALMSRSQAQAPVYQIL
jgi:hypothetical protein